MPKFEVCKAFDHMRGITIRLVADSTGVKLSNRGEWIRVTWKVRRGFFKTHTLVYLDPKRVLAFNLTGTKGGDATQLPGLLCMALGGCAGRSVSLAEPIADMVMDAAAPSKGGRKDGRKQILIDHWMYENEDGKDTPRVDEDGIDASDIDCTMDVEFARMCGESEKLGIKIELRADGGYDGRETFALLAALGIIPVIKVRVNSNARAGGVNHSRPNAALDQLGGKGNCTGKDLNRMTSEERKANRKEWKNDAKYGLRWLVEIIISAFKRVFGESVRALTPRTAFIEIATRVAAYNRNLDIGDEAIRDAVDRRANSYGSVCA